MTTVEKSKKHEHREWNTKIYKMITRDEHVVLSYAYVEQTKR